MKFLKFSVQRLGRSSRCCTRTPGNVSMLSTTTNFPKNTRKGTIALHSRIYDFAFPAQTSLPQAMMCRGKVLCRSLSTPTKQTKQRGFVPRKAALNLTPTARKFCKLLLKNSADDVEGIILKYQMSSAGDMRMVFSLDFVKRGSIGSDAEGVSLEVLEDGSPKPPSESDNDGLKKLYIHETAFMKVLGGKMDIKIEKDGSFNPMFTDREGNELDPNN